MHDDARTADLRSIERLIASLQEAWAVGDADAFARRFTEDGTFTNVLGMFFQGRAAFRERHDAVFRTVFKGSTLKLRIAVLRFIRPDVVIADTDAELRNPAALPEGLSASPDGTVYARLLMVLVKERDEWWISAYHNVPVVPSQPRR
ncbi:MAG: SgcJ/EcaC family oxidoreductase [Steroidobacteraceae bacterium]|nr:SgcJ/EcaC family oxidoreductase [Steroidobacteraceae bacterium]